MRREMQAEKRRLELVVTDYEARLDRAEAEKRNLVATLADNAPDTDFAGLTRRLKELDGEIEQTSAGWEEYALQLEAFMVEYNRIGE
ncbi:MAG: hypothetical protein PHQ27_07880 [Victivallales bacterium]|nr:hypothetical protein [Victivallales bacterium]